MAFSHSFSSGFYYDEAENAPDKSKHPTSVSMALRSMPKRVWNLMCKEVFHCKPEFVDIETVMEKIRETDTVSNLSVPVTVWIDSDGCFTVDVYNVGE